MYKWPEGYSIIWTILVCAASKGMFLWPFWLEVGYPFYHFGLK